MLDDLEPAYNNYHFKDSKNSLDIVIYQKFKSRSFIFDINFLIKELELYLNPYFVNILEVVSLNLDSISSRKHLDNSKIDIRSYSIFCDHKIIMELRVKYLINKGYIKNNSLLKAAIKVKNYYFIIRNMVIKYNIKPDLNYMKKIQEAIDDAVTEEKRFIENLLIDLHSNSAIGNSPISN